MSERLAPWRPRPTQELLEVLRLVPDTVMYLVHRTGPTSFVMREDGSEIKRKVSIGARPSCSCMAPGAAGSCKELCIHLLFVMVKVLRVPPSNPLVWQLSLTDRELEEVLRCGALPEAPPPPPPRRAEGTVNGERGEPGQVKRRPLDEEEPCPICYEDMANADVDALVWCRFGCGRNVHGKCMGIWAEHQQRTLGKELSCPLCRGAWGDFKWKPPPPKKKRAADKPGAGGPGAAHMGTHCGVCKRAPLVGKRYRCLICADYDLCDGCFERGEHAQHPFACRESPTSFATPAERPVMMPLVTRLVTGGPAAAATLTAVTAHGSEVESVGVADEDTLLQDQGHAASHMGGSSSMAGAGAGAGSSELGGGEGVAAAGLGVHARGGRPPAAIAAARAAEARAAAAAAAAAAGEAGGVGVEGPHAHASAAPVMEQARRRQHVTRALPAAAAGDVVAAGALGGLLEVQGVAGGGAPSANTNSRGARGPSAVVAGHPPASSGISPAHGVLSSTPPRVRRGLARQGLGPGAMGHEEVGGLGVGVAGVRAPGAAPTAQGATEHGVPSSLAMDTEVVALLEGRGMDGRGRAAHRHGPSGLSTGGQGPSGPSPMRARSNGPARAPLPSAQLPPVFNVAGHSVLPQLQDPQQEQEVRLGGGLPAQGGGRARNNVPRTLNAALDQHRRFARGMADAAAAPKAPQHVPALGLKAVTDGLGPALTGRALAPTADYGFERPPDLAPPQAQQQVQPRLMRGRPPLPHLGPGQQHADARMPGGQQALRPHAFGSTLTRAPAAAGATAGPGRPVAVPQQPHADLQLDVVAMPAAGPSVMLRSRSARSDTQASEIEAMEHLPPLHHQHYTSGSDTPSDLGFSSDQHAGLISPLPNEILHLPVFGAGPLASLHRSMSAGVLLGGNVGSARSWFRPVSAVSHGDSYDGAEGSLIHEMDESWDDRALQSSLQPVLQQSRGEVQEWRQENNDDVLLASTSSLPRMSSSLGAKLVAGMPQPSWPAAAESPDGSPGRWQDLECSHMNAADLAEVATGAAGSSLDLAASQPDMFIKPGTASGSLREAVPSHKQLGEVADPGPVAEGVQQGAAAQITAGYGQQGGADDAMHAWVAAKGMPGYAHAPPPMQIDEDGAWATLYSNAAFNLTPSVDWS